MARKEEDFSDFVCKTLHTIGYSWKSIQQRREFAKYNEKALKTVFLLDSGLRIIWAGSQREGSTTLFGGDHDHMLVLDEVMATEDVRVFERKENTTVLKLVTDGVSPGYTFLVVHKHGGRLGRNKRGDVRARSFMRSFLSDCCKVLDSGQTCLSSEIFIRNIFLLTQLERNKMLNKCTFASAVLVHFSPQPRAGPSTPINGKLTSNTSFSLDKVYSLPCYCPSVLASFLNRPRAHGWPTEDAIEELSQLQAHVVPVGFKRSANHFLEWRICFTKAEIRLIEDLTEPQFYVFILLKIFAKDVLKNVWDAMTSYMMKNVILWVTELTPGHRFRTDTVVDRFLGCLFFLKMCVKVGRLPSYMISERNLLSHEEFVVKRPKLLSVLDDCLREKGSCLMRSSRLKDAMTTLYRFPDSATKNGSERERIESIILLVLRRFFYFINPLQMTVQDCDRLAKSEAIGLRQLLTPQAISDIQRDPLAFIDKMK